MDNTEKIAEILKTFPLQEYQCKAIALMLDINGYGNTKAAVKEFVQEFKRRFFFMMATNMKSPVYQCTGEELDRLVKEVCGDDK